jgi:imidazolonepropionase-like amidohydrolase
LTRFRTALAALGLAAAMQAAPAAAENLVIEHVTVVDGTGRPAQSDMSVVVEGDRFTRIVPSSALGNVSGRRIDGRGKFLMPGLIDVHIHLRGARGEGARMVGIAKPGAAAPTAPIVKAGPAAINREGALGALAGFIYSGVTSVYDAGNDPKLILPLRAEERAGKIASPRIFATGNLITTPGGHGGEMAITVESWPQAKAALDRHIAEQQPDMVKLTYDEHGWGSRPQIPLLPPELMQEIVKYYNQHGIRSTVHTSNENRSIEAIYAGVDTLAHPVIQGPVSDEFVRLMGAKKTPFASTLTIGEGYSRLVEHPEFLDQPLYQAALTPAEIADLRAKTLPQWRERPWTWWMKLMTPIAQENIRKIDAAGGVVAVGSDQSLGPATHREMELLQAAGIAPLEVIRAATLNGARFLGKEDQLGSIEPGKLADAVLLNADPGRDVNNAKQIALVIKGGRIVREAELPLPGGPRANRLP